MSDYELPFVDPETMRLGDYVPAYVIRIGRWWWEFYKMAAQAKRRDAGFGGYWLTQMFCEGAFYVLMLAQCKWKSWAGTLFFGEAEEAAHDFLTSSGGKLETIGIRGRKHEEMEPWAAGDKVEIFYPVRQPFEIARFIIGASYKFVHYQGQTEQSTLVALWGAVKGSEMIEKIEDEVNYPRYTEGNNPCIRVGLREWDRDLLDWIVQTRDEDPPEDFKRLMEKWGASDSD